MCQKKNPKILNNNILVEKVVFKAQQLHRAAALCHVQSISLLLLWQACAKSTMVLHSYGMLLPCGIDKFHGTEYVCCPSSRSGESAPPSLPSQEDDEEEEIEDEEIDETDLVEEEDR